MKIFIFSFICILKIILIYNEEVITDFKQLIDSLNKNIVTLNDAKKIINSTKIIFKEYPFTNILKDPPLINEKQYFEPVDLLSNLDSLQSEIEKTSTSSIKFYEFYPKYYKIIRQTNDFHTHTDYEKNDNLKNLVIISPIIVKTINDKKKLYLSTNYFIEFLEIAKFIPNYNKIKNKENISIKSINDKEPFEFIRNFCKDYFTFKNKNAKFTYTKMKLFYFNLFECPMNSDDFNLKIKYEDDEEIETKIIGVYQTYNNQNNNEKNFEYFRNFLKKEKENKKNGIINQNSLKKLLKSKSDNKTIFRILDEEIEWDVDRESFKCRVDYKNKVNVYFQNSFRINIEDPTILMQMLIYCQNNFLNNDYPIVIIEDSNGGGYIHFSMLFLEIVQNLYNNQLKCSIRIGDYTKEISDYNDLYLAFLKENEDLYENNEEFLSDITIDKLSETNENVRTKQRSFFIHEIQFYKDLIIRNRYKKPTEIIIFTDGYSFNATSLFIKSLYHFGGAITVGFNGDPETEKKDFDASQSPTFVISNEEMPIQAFEDLQKYGFNFEQISYIPSYKNQYIEGKLDYPEEFQVTPVDERVDIYDGYDDSLYQNFIDKAKEIFKKYNEDGKCNPDNKNLKMLNSECDKNFDEYTYGGYECGDDGKWSKNCKPFYCHENYYFDYVNQKCIKDTIAEKYSVYFSEEETTKEKKLKN